MNRKEIEPYSLALRDLKIERTISFEQHLDSENPFIIKNLHEKWGLSPTLKSPNPIAFKRKLALKPIPRIRRKVVNSRQLKPGFSSEPINEPAIIESLDTTGLVGTFSPANTKRHFLLRKLVNVLLLTSIKNLVINRTKTSPLQSDIKKDKLNQIITYQKKNIKQEVPVQKKINDSTMLHSAVKKEVKNKKPLANNSYFIILLICLNRLSKKYKRLKKSSLRLKKYKALQKKWKLRKIRKKNQKRIEQSRYQFFSPGKSSLDSTKKAISLERTRSSNAT